MIAERSGGTMTLYVHGGSGASGIEDMQLAPPLVRTVDVGPRRSAPARFFSPGRSLRGFQPVRDGVEAVIVQGPSPLLPHIVRACGDVPVALLIGGDYAGWRSQEQFPPWRNAAIRLWATLYGMRQRRASRGHLAFVNNPHLISSVPHATVKTVTFTPVSEASIGALEPVSTDWGTDKARSDPLRLLYSGRIVRDKGVLEAVRCIDALRARGYTASLDLVGWTQDSDPVLDDVRRLAESLDVEALVHIRGYIPSGPELFRAYARADVFVIPTYWDSLPRSMLEAMAIGLPVVATDVGGIGHFFRDRDTALLVEPRRVDQLADAIEQLILDPELRKRVAEKGRAWSLEHTQEAESEQIVSEVRKHIASAKVGP
jgi:glycosyltransferase involved in cell wall biosynthesis